MAAPVGSYPASVRDLARAERQLVVVSAVLLTLVRLLVRLRGMQRTASLLAARSDGAPRTPMPGTETRVAAAVAIVSKWRVLGATCLPTALTTWFLLRRRGVDAVLVIGAAAPLGGEMSAHAWVEVDGSPLNEAADIRERFVSLGVALPRLASFQT